jgi:hypothetical protein
LCQPEYLASLHWECNGTVSAFFKGGDHCERMARVALGVLDGDVWEGWCVDASILRLLS